MNNTEELMEIIDANEDSMAAKIVSWAPRHWVLLEKGQVSETLLASVLYFRKYQTAKTLLALSNIKDFPREDLAFCLKLALVLKSEEDRNAQYEFLDVLMPYLKREGLSFTLDVIKTISLKKSREEMIRSEFAYVLTQLGAQEDTLINEVWDNYMTSGAYFNQSVAYPLRLIKPGKVTTPEDFYKCVEMINAAGFLFDEHADNLCVPKRLGEAFKSSSEYRQAFFSRLKREDIMVLDRKCLAVACATTALHEESIKSGEILTLFNKIKPFASEVDEVSGLKIGHLAILHHPELIHHEHINKIKPWLMECDHKGRSGCAYLFASKMLMPPSLTGKTSFVSCFYDDLLALEKCDDKKFKQGVLTYLNDAYEIIGECVNTPREQLISSHFVAEFISQTKKIEDMISPERKVSFTDNNIREYVNSLPVFLKMMETAKGASAFNFTSSNPWYFLTDKELDERVKVGSKEEKEMLYFSGMVYGHGVEILGVPEFGLETLKTWREMVELTQKSMTLTSHDEFISTANEVNHLIEKSVLEGKFETAKPKKKNL